MRLTLDALLVLDAIDRKGSFAAAADEINRVPSAVTYTISKLEQDLDVRLFDRSGHRARLTEAGRKLLDDGRRLLRAAAELEHSVKRVATGRELELRIAVVDIIPLERLFPLLHRYYAEDFGTQLRISREVFGGAWDALVSARADLVIGAVGEGPAGGNYNTRLLGDVEFILVVPPQHPLATRPEPLSVDDLLEFRVVAAADSSRNLPPRTSALLSGQDVLTVPDMDCKLNAQRDGLGVGFVPRNLVAQDLADGHLVERTATTAVAPVHLSLAWRDQQIGEVMRWFLRQFEDTELCSTLLR